VRALGGAPVLGPALRADAPAPDAAIAPALEAALAAPLDQAVFLTGVGAALTFSLSARLGREGDLRAALAGARVVARGPKPRRALRAVGVAIDWVVDPPRSGVIRDGLLARPVAGSRILVQGFGPEPEDLTAPLRAAGAEVLVLSPYAGAWPQDPGPARTLARAAAGGALDALTFTSAQAASQFAALAEEAGVDAGAIARAGVLIAAVGPVTRAALERAGLPVHVQPDPPRMGALYRALAAALERPPRCGRPSEAAAISSAASEGARAGRT